MLRGKRVRGWNLLYLAAADHPAYYDRWVKRGEPNAIRIFCADRQPENELRIACVILDSGDNASAKKTFVSARRALPANTPIWTDIAALTPEGAMLIDSRSPLKDILDSIGTSADWLLPLKAGDRISPSLGTVLQHTNPDPDNEPVVFWDEDVLRDGRRQDPWIKPDWDPILFRARDGVTGACAIAMEALCRHKAQKYESFDAATFARIIRHILADDSIDPLHIPLILTHRSDGVPFIPQAVHLAALVENPGALNPVTPARWPVVSIIIPTRDRADLLETCLNGLARLGYPGDVELLIVDNDSLKHETLALFARAEQTGARVLHYPGPFNYAALVNHAASIASGEIFCLLNNDIELLDADWLTQMVRYAGLDQIGAVGARLLYPSGRLQHAGVVIGIGGAAGHVQKGVDPVDPRFADWHAHSRIVSAVTGACLVVAREKFQAVGCLDSDGFAVDFNDVDFCLRLQAAGLVNVLAVEATLIHRESESRGLKYSAESSARFAHELDLLHTRWLTAGFNDPHYSPLFRREYERCILAF